MILEILVKTLIGFALGSLLSLGTVTSAFASGTSVAGPASFADDGVEVIVVTAKRPTPSNAERTPPAMPIVMPKLELAAEPLVIRL